MLKNYMEIIVEDVLEKLSEKNKLKCQCEICKNDIMALALNNLQTLYVVSEKGILYTKLNEFSVQFQTDVIQEILMAIEKVNKNPKH